MGVGHVKGGSCTHVSSVYGDHSNIYNFGVVKKVHVDIKLAANDQWELQLVQFGGYVDF